MISMNYKSAGLFTESEFSLKVQEAVKVFECINNTGSYPESIGWLDPLKWAGIDSLNRLSNWVKQISDDSVLVLIGVGGSNNGARAAINALKGNREVIYAGNNLSSDYYEKVFEKLEGKSVYLNVIAKNFETLEPGLAFRIFRQYMVKRYGENYSERIFVTGTVDSYLHDLCITYNYTFLTFPSDVGGRFSVLSDVGLFPMIFSGLDINEMVSGALDMRKQINTCNEDNLMIQYATFRNLLLSRGFKMEMLVNFEPRLDLFSKWWIQLFAESEGKDGKGLFPVASSYSEDLHSIGQYVQDGSRIIFETFLNIQNSGSELVVHSDLIDDHFDYLNGKTFHEINQSAFHATTKAHEEEGIPQIVLHIPEVSAYYLGQLFYFFEMSVYLSATLIGVDPFNQPGVESYKKYMFSLLGKDSTL